MEALRVIDGETSQFSVCSIQPSDINREKCFRYGFENIPETITAHGIVGVYQTRGTWGGSVTESEVAARFSWIVKQFAFPSLVRKGHLSQSGEDYFPTNKFIQTCYQAGLK